ncbi:hypothetical protein BGW36DRAFT_456886 [Talaromyces proteolyticus]|uniref:FAD-binding domain-containing protein n=1 Tax=Talaromyces proteolyticus TaxID=1131652 RepID=A0AAD4L1I1_9EURO|nr:uncharacterized protein BGW36DRAFT_456886 [Talaromyces proteolyticus]KAH8705419.1 hypothetical protein BGW36DRAFT_456886 [Talaromyces proteolyticus]
MASDNECETGVIICGCGPTGALLSVLLGQHHVPHVVLEKEPDVVEDPRGIGLDEEGIRYLQACGIYEKIFTDIGHSQETFMFIGGSKKDLSARPFMDMTYGTTEGGTGHPGFMCHNQPVMEKHLRSRIEELKVGELRVGCRVISIREDDEWVYVQYVDDRDHQKSIRARFLVGADGKTGFTRKQYLEPRGVQLEKLVDMTYEEDWVAINWRISLPTPDTHPDFPLWEKGYTPQQVYDEFFPTNFRFLCNPQRSAVCGRFGLPKDRLWRFEFVVLNGESPQEMATFQKMAEVVYPYITHPGKRHGITAAEVRFPSDCIEVMRCQPFRFSARSCNRWSLDRTILCGDAAHVFPPFGAQGISSGFRDAISLAWRLRLAIQHSESTSHQDPKMDHRQLFEGWYSERKQQLDASLRATIENGAYVTESDSLKVFLRDWFLWLVQMIPSWKHWLQLGGRRDGMIQYRWEDGRGMAFLPSLGGGGCFPQVYAAVVGGTGKVSFTDDIIFSPSKQGLFQLVVLAKAAAELDELEPSLAGLKEKSNGALLPGEVSIFAEDSFGTSVRPNGRVVYRFATGDQFANDPLCAGRFKPVGYDRHQMAKAARGNKFVVLRPDRFVFAACSTTKELHEVAGRIGHLVVRGGL